MTTRRTEYPTGEDATSALAPGAADGFLVPGAVVGDGRYRLLGRFGADERAHAELWRAQDGQLRRDVALTLLLGDPADQAAVQGSRKTLERAAHAARLAHSGTSRVLDVLNPGNGVGAAEGLLGIVVADWSHGTDLADLVAEGPLPPSTAARLVEPLAGAVEQAHHTGLVLGVDHPQRIRVTPEGRLRLAFPGPLPEAGLQDDVKGLGAVLYLLLTGRWPLAGGPPEIPRAPIGPDGAVVAPSALFPYIPHELSAAAVRSVDDTTLGGLRTPASLIRVLERVAQPDGDTDLISPVSDEDDEDDDGTVWTTRRPSNDRNKRRKLAIGVTALAVATVGVLAWVGMQLISFFGDEAPGAGGPTVVVTPPGNAQSNPAPRPGAPIKSAGVQVYNVKGKGTPDNPKRANRAVDGDPKTAWRTDKYQQPFPALKPGIGIMASFAEAVPFAEVVIDSPSDGTVVEIRTAPSDDPALEDTKVIGMATLQPGQTKLQLNSSEPTQHLLVWITRLSEGNVSELTEIGFVRAQ